MKVSGRATPADLQRESGCPDDWYKSAVKRGAITAGTDRKVDRKAFFEKVAKPKVEQIEERTFGEQGNGVLAGSHEKRSFMKLARWCWEFERELEIQESGGEDRNALSVVDAQGLADQDKLERMDRAVITEDAKENAEKLATINKSLLDGARARENERNEHLGAWRLADTSEAMNACIVFFRDVFRGLETFVAQQTDHVARETGVAKADVRKVLETAMKPWKRIFMDAVAALRARAEERKAAARAKFGKKK